MKISTLALVALLGSASAAAQAQPAQPSPDALARQAVELMMQALQGAIANLPQYAPPEIDADGNITIRRLNPPRSTGQVPSRKDDGLSL
ncbi:MAG: hypothetical protein GC202_07990 [Alphaproteobacteria bacterium]|nr:hypothetical protein [Alphaproteobacteria bacterium]